jgi:hypothetical protein
MLTKALSVDPVYLRYKKMDQAIDYRVIYYDFFNLMLLIKIILNNFSYYEALGNSIESTV